MTLQEYQNTCAQLMQMESLLVTLPTDEEKRKGAFSIQVRVLDLVEHIAMEPKDLEYDAKFAAVRGALQHATLGLAKAM